jgi:PAS domain S-box-containing protein
MFTEMKKSIKPLTDPKRLRTLSRTLLMDSPRELAFDRLTRLAVRLLGAPVSLLSLVDDQRQFFKSIFGLPEPWNSARGTPLTHSFCQHVVNSGGPLIVNDAKKNHLVKKNLAIPDLGVAAYAGIPIKTRGGETLGSFCVIDTKPRVWTPPEVALLRELAHFCMSEISLREKVAEQAESVRRFHSWLERMPVGAFACDDYLRITDWNPAAEKLFGFTKKQAIGRSPAKLIFKAKQRQWAEEFFGDLSINGHAEDNRTNCVTCTGKLVRCDWTITTLLDVDGGFGGFIAMVEKIAPAARKKKR